MTSANKRAFAAMFLILVIGSGAGMTAAEDQDDVRRCFAEALMEHDRNWDPEAADEFAGRILDVIEAEGLSLAHTNIEEIAFGLSHLPNLSAVTKATHPMLRNLLEQRIDFIIMNYYHSSKKTPPEAIQELFRQMEAAHERIAVQIRNKYAAMHELVESILAKQKEGMNNMCLNRLRQNFKKPVSPESMNEVYKYWTEELAKLPDIDDSFHLRMELNRITYQGLFKISDETSVEQLPMPDALKRAEDEVSENAAVIAFWQSSKRREAMKKQVEIGKIVNQAKAAALVAQETMMDDIDTLPLELSSVQTVPQTSQHSSKDNDESDNESPPHIVHDINESQEPIDKDTSLGNTYSWCTVSVAVLLAALTTIGIAKKRKRKVSP